MRNRAVDIAELVTMNTRTDREEGAGEMRLFDGGGKLFVDSGEIGETRRSLRETMDLVLRRLTERIDAKRTGMGLECAIRIGCRILVKSRDFMQ